MAGILLLGLSLRCSGLNCSPIPILTSMCFHSIPVSSSMIITFWPLGVGLECNSIMVPPQVACIDWNIASLNCLLHLAQEGRDKRLMISRLHLSKTEIDECAGIRSWFNVLYRVRVLMG